MATLYFTKRFTSGALKGMIYHSKVTLSSPEACLAFAERATTKGIRSGMGGASWVMVDRSFQKYDRS